MAIALLGGEILIFGLFAFYAVLTLAIPRRRLATIAVALVGLICVTATLQSPFRYKYAVVFYSVTFGSLVALLLTTVLASARNTTWRLRFHTGDLLEYSVFVALPCTLFQVINPWLAAWVVLLIAYVAGLFFFVRWEPAPTTTVDDTRNGDRQNSQ